MALRTPPPQDAQLELFSAIFTDVVTRDAQETMEAPFLSLSKKPRFEPIQYKSNGVEVIVSGGKPWGIANIWDWDLIMWLLSQVRSAIDGGQEVSPVIRFHRYSFLKAVRSHTGGKQYERLEQTITRLKNTHVRTSIRARRGKTAMFNWLEWATIERDEKGRLAHAVVKLPDWLFEAVRDRRLILSLHRDYFLLTGGLERWLYRLVRKQAGNNRQGWLWKMRTLYERSGSSQTFADFVRDLRRVIRREVLLDYELNEEEKDGEKYVRAKRIGNGPHPVEDGPEQPENSVAFVPTRNPLQVRLVTYEAAKRLAPGYDIYALEADWRDATTRNNVCINDPDKAFLAWCRTVASRRPLQSNH